MTGMGIIARLAAALAAASALIAAPASAQQQPDPKLIQEIYDCLAVGLPKDWRKAWVVVSDLGETGKDRRYEGKFHYATSASDKAGRPLVPCSAQQVAKGVVALSDALPADKRRWKRVTLTFTSEGKFDLYYDYGK
jgi:hypothetical protein